MKNTENQSNNQLNQYQQERRILVLGAGFSTVGVIATGAFSAALGVDSGMKVLKPDKKPSQQALSAEEEWLQAQEVLDKIEKAIHSRTESAQNPFIDNAIESVKIWEDSEEQEYSEITESPDGWVNDYTDAYASGGFAVGLGVISGLLSFIRKDLITQLHNKDQQSDF